MRFHCDALCSMWIFESTALLAAGTSHFRRSVLVSVVTVIMTLCWLVPAGRDLIHRLQYHACCVEVVVFYDLLSILMAEGTSYYLMRA